MAIQDAGVDNDAQLEIRLVARAPLDQQTGLPELALEENGVRVAVAAHAVDLVAHLRLEEVVVVERGIWQGEADQAMWTQR